MRFWWNSDELLDENWMTLVTFLMNLLNIGWIWTDLAGGFKYFLFSPYLGKWSNLTDIFQRGWNHQLVNWWISRARGRGSQPPQNLGFCYPHLPSSIPVCWDRRSQVWLTRRVSRGEIWRDGRFAGWSFVLGVCIVLAKRKETHLVYT